MSEYWKSLPRKFCDICKCWFADNRASIDFHERGKRHQENAQKRIQDIKKRGLKDAKKEKELEDDMARIERAALAAYKKDLQNNLATVSESDLNLLNSSTNLLNSSTSFVEVPVHKKAVVEPKTKKSKKAASVKKKEPPKLSPKWYEAMSDEGHKYYWNTENSDTQWEPPEEGFVSLEEQEKINSETTIETEKSSSAEKTEENDTEDEPVCSIGPQPKVDPYGGWVTIDHREPEEVDYQLPKPRDDVVEVVIPFARDEPRLKIKEKVIGQLSSSDDSSQVTFKKRKFTGNLKRNSRQRTDDD